MTLMIGWRLSDEAARHKCEILCQQCTHARGVSGGRMDQTFHSKYVIDLDFHLNFVFGGRVQETNSHQDLCDLTVRCFASRQHLPFCVHHVYFRAILFCDSCGTRAVSISLKLIIRIVFDRV